MLEHRFVLAYILPHSSDLRVVGGCSVSECCDEGANQLSEGSAHSFVSEDLHRQASIEAGTDMCT